MLAARITLTNTLRGHKSRLFLRGALLSIYFHLQLFYADFGVIFENSNVGCRVDTGHCDLSTGCHYSCSN